AVRRLGVGRVLVLQRDRAGGVAHDEAAAAATGEYAGASRLCADASSDVLGPCHGESGFLGAGSRRAGVLQSRALAWLARRRTLSDAADGRGSAGEPGRAAGGKRGQLDAFVPSRVALMSASMCSR